MKAADLPERYNAVEILERNLPQRAHKVALYSERRNPTFAEVAEEVNRVGNALIDLGVGFADPVGILAPDGAEWVTTFFGAIKIGAVAVGLNTELEPHEYAHILDDCRCRVLIVHASLTGRLEPIRDRLPALRQVVVIGAPERGEDIAFADWIRDRSTRIDAVQTHRDDPCSLHYTSGTTGQSKGVLHAHKDYPLIAANTGVDLFALTERDRTFAVSKLYFVYGLGGNLVMPWSVGAAIVLYAGSARLGHAVLDVIDRHRPSVLFSVPTGFAGMLAAGALDQRPGLAAIRLCISAGEALSETLWERWKTATGLEVLDTVGCTETFHTFLANRPHDLRPGSSGKPSPGYAVRLVDDDGRETEQGEVGHLLVKGESIARSYLHHDTPGDRTVQGPWLRTGDLYRRDADGFYWHAGRADDMFKVGGLWVSPVEVEAALMRHPAVRQCAVVESRDPSGMIKPKAFLCLADGFLPGKDLIREILGHCAGHLAPFKCPARFEFMADLPVTATGKIQRYKLRARARAAKNPSSEQTMSPQQRTAGKRTLPESRGEDT
jgi:benzoate-CoA ligase family protein